MNDKTFIKKGTKLFIRSSRRSSYKAVSGSDFYLSDEWYHVITLEPVDGLTRKGKWQKGDSVPCRNGIDKIEILEDKE